MIETLILHGDPAGKIVKYAAQTAADVIVIGNRGRDRFARALLDSVSGLSSGTASAP